MKSLEELREFFSHDRYATATTGIEILEARDGYADGGCRVRGGFQPGCRRRADHIYLIQPDQLSDTG